MPFFVEHLIGTQQKLVTVRPTNSAKLAYELMNEHDFSQLPVIDDSGKPLGLVTGDSILNALANFGVGIADLRVSAAIKKVRTYGKEDNLFDLLNDLKESYAVLIVDREDKLTGIVTSADTTEYFRRYAEDLMLVEDIETLLKEMILSTFTNDAGELDETVLTETIKGMTARGKDLREKFQKALDHYLCNQDGGDVELDRRKANAAFDAVFALKNNSKPFNKLTLSQYIDLLMHEKVWEYVQSDFSLNKKAVEKLLRDVRDTRNTLAHFRDEISARQRNQLRFCADWLARHKPATNKNVIIKIDSALEIKTEMYPVAISVNEGGETEDDLRFDDVLDSSDSRYAPLAIYLQNLSPTQEFERLTFDHVEVIIDHNLPPSAWNHRAWWANDSVGHPHSKLWLEVGWRVAEINLSEAWVLFKRIKERGKDLNEFYAALYQGLQKKAEFEIMPPRAEGSNHYLVVSLPSQHKRCGLLLFYFSRKRKFKTEFYLSSTDKERNRRLFDFLYSRRTKIEEEIGEPLNWNRQDNCIASRISLEREGSITDKELWESLRNWAVDTVIRFHKAFFKDIEEFCNLQ